MNKRYIKPDTTHLPTDKLLPVHVKELPHHGLETCLACKVIKDLRINNFNNIPSNCVDTPESVHPDKKQNIPMGKVASKYQVGEIRIPDSSRLSTHIQ